MAKVDVLVSGACGHLGWALMTALPTYGYTPVGVDILPSKDSSHVVLVGSISDADFCRMMFSLHPEIKYVLHTATLHKPHVGTHSKSDFVATNVQGTLNLLEAASANGRTEGFVFTSTTSAYGKALAPEKGQPAVWVDETVIPVPKNIYGATKVAAEDLCELVQAETGMPTIVLRTSRFFPEPDDNAASRAEFDDDNLKVCELLYRRVDIHDVATAHICAMRKAKSVGWAKYIISAPPPFVRSATLLEALDGDAAAEVSRTRPDLVKVLLEHGWKLPARLDRVYDPSKAIRELSWSPMYTFDRAVSQVARDEDWRSELSVRTGKRGYHAVPTGVYTS